MTRRPGISDHPLTSAGRSERQQRGGGFLAVRLITTGHWRSAAEADEHGRVPVNLQLRALAELF